MDSRPPPGRQEVQPIDPSKLDAISKLFAARRLARRAAFWTTGVELALTANDKDWGGRPAIDHLIWQTIPDGTVRLSALKTGSMVLREVKVSETRGGRP